MGTNYYLATENRCAACGHDSGEELHIGKSSAGWCFSLHVIPEKEINTLEDWKKRWSEPGVVIRDEYHRVHTPDEMEDVITKRGPRTVGHIPFGYTSWDHFHRSNESEMGPNGMLRHRLGGQFSCKCVGHGEGTWDYITGEFS